MSLKLKLKISARHYYLNYSTSMLIRIQSSTRILFTFMTLILEF